MFKLEDFAVDHLTLLTMFCVSVGRSVCVLCVCIYIYIYGYKRESVEVRDVNALIVCF